jgi:superfamily II DNA or RNA helicase
MDVIQSLVQSYHTGFIDYSAASVRDYRPELITNDRSAGKKVLTTVLRELSECDEFWFSIAFITTGGVAALINTLVEVEKRGVKGKILASQYLNFTQPEALKRIRRFRNIDLRIDTLNKSHSKGYLFRKMHTYTLLVGSSNLTQNALSINKEWNLKVTATGGGEIIRSVMTEFTRDFTAATQVTDDYLDGYQRIIASLRRMEAARLKQPLVDDQPSVVQPNNMQSEALLNLEVLRDRGKKRGLLISATGTGKTYLAAFDVERVRPRKFLFVVHRRNIALAAMKTFRKVLGGKVTMGLYSGDQQELESDYVFATIQTLSKENHLNGFASDHFDYIVIDETHRAGAISYERVINHFKPAFLLGMTATPERTDGYDVFTLFEHNIAYEMRLNEALEEEMVSPFHYYGVTDLTINGELVDEEAAFNKLVVEERVDRIIEKIELYGTDSGETKGLVFCSRKEECQSLAKAFSRRGWRSLALTGDNSEAEREQAIKQLESDDPEYGLDYIFTVDIFNEGIDIPKVNQVVMLRPTQSAIVFVQQMGRGLRKIDGKDYLTIIDFIGNYKNNYLVPVALYGDNSYNKDQLRKLIASGSRLVAGCSTINFEQIAKEQILKAIDDTNMQTLRDLRRDYDLLKFKLGRVPMMVDFLDYKARDPILYVTYAKSYYNFVAKREKWDEHQLSNFQQDVLKFFAIEINNTKRVEESILLEALIIQGCITVEEFREKIRCSYARELDDETIKSIIGNLNLRFATETKGTREAIGERYGIDVVETIGEEMKLTDQFKGFLTSECFKHFLLDNTMFAIQKYKADFSEHKYQEGFLRYHKYTRKDVFRILNWSQNPLAQNVGGYMVSKDKSNCAIFVN